MYLKSIEIKNFRGIKNLFVPFEKDLNVIIGPNGSHKTTIIDALRLLYNWGKGGRTLEVTPEDFHSEISDTDRELITQTSNTFSIEYIFDDLSPEQQGAFYSFLVLEDEQLYAQVNLTYEITDKGRIVSNFTTGNPEAGQKADWNTFNYFISYYLGALRDSTRDLMSTRNNILGRVIKKKIDRRDTEEEYREIIDRANTSLLEMTEVQSTKEEINNNLNDIYRSQSQQVGLRIEQSRIEYIINIIKPYIEHNKVTRLSEIGLRNNSLGFNNILYIATVLGDLAELQADDNIPVCALFIEEPEAHLHPQLQVNLYNFIKGSEKGKNTQVFITTHSPSLASKIPLENLIVLNSDSAINVGDCFIDREKENIVYNNSQNDKVDADRTSYYKNMISRYLDVTRSQLLFSRGCCFVEGISEGLLINTFSKITKKCLTDNEVEIVDTGGTAFYQFLMLYNSSEENKRLSQNIAIITDGDQYPSSQEAKYSTPQKLLEDDCSLLEELRINIENGQPCSRITNLTSMSNRQPNIMIAYGEKTLEFEICRSNIGCSQASLSSNLLYKLIKKLNPSECAVVDGYISSISSENDFSDEEKTNIALLLWKSLPNKAEFAQELMMLLEEELRNGDHPNFTVPDYIQNAINHLV